MLDENRSRAFLWGVFPCRQLQTLPFKAVHWKDATCQEKASTANTAQATSKKRGWKTGIKGGTIKHLILESGSPPQLFLNINTVMKSFLTNKWFPAPFSNSSPTESTYWELFSPSWRTCSFGRKLKFLLRSPLFKQILNNFILVL